ncbi:FHA domain-containing protein [Microbacterium sp. P26]|uniref:FHA domain-containing protein n=1 Tax=Microbacterium TaxID=33882 RepID=UPI00203CCCC4|nr:FHA domain-containing protein [Microbacterium sp. P26]MCM3501257.1 FHA domain-containing protein [Microbacterium sp. P26]
MDALSLIAVTAGAVLVLALVLHVWYAIGLSRVFAGRGGEPWRAWIPLLNEAEIFRLGRQDPVRAVLLLVPGVNVYGLVLKARAAHRLGEPSGRGAGTTALALVFPPAWAGVLAAGGKTPDAVDHATDDDAEVVTMAEGEPAPISAVPGAEESGAAVSTAAPSAASSATPSSASSATTDPPPPAAAAGGRRARSVAQETPSVLVLPGPVVIGEVPAEETTVAPRGAASLADGPVAEVPAAVPAVEVPRSAPSVEVASSAPDVEVPAVAAGAETPVTVAADAGAPAVADGAETAVAATAAADAPAAERAELGRVAETTDSTAQRPDEQSSAAASPIEEMTQTARPRSRRRGEWSLRLPGGDLVALESRTVVLGRRPSADDEGVQYVTVTDDTRTMSKRHARLDWTVTGWTITDLESTNGVTLAHDDGRVEKLPAGGTAIVPNRFRLGDAQVELRPEATV